MTALQDAINKFISPSVSSGARVAQQDQAWKVWLLRQAPLLGPLGALVLMICVFGGLSEDFLTSDNMWNILAQVSVLAVMATGVTFVLLLGEIDLGFANIAVLSGIGASLLYAGKKVGLPLVGQVSFGSGSWAITIGTALAIALLLGLVGGLITARLGVPSFIATLGILMLAQGWAFYWARGENVYSAIPLAHTLGATFIGPVPVIAISAAAVLLVAHIVLSRTRFGRYVYMTGANRSAAELSGIPTKRVVLIVFALSGVLAGIAGILNVGRLGAAQANAGGDLLLPVIAAVVLGGTSLFGGRGGIPYTVVGLLLFGTIDNGLDQLNLDPYLKPFVRGLLLLLAIILNVMMLHLASRARAHAPAGQPPGATSDGDDRATTPVSQPA
jgi:ribose transport system permease protein